jgi:bacteriorhodopsin
MSAMLSSAILAWSIHGGNDWGYYPIGGVGLLVVIVVVVLLLRR